MSKFGKSRPEKKLVIKVPNSIQRISTWGLLKMAFNVWIDKITYKKQPFSDPAAGMPNMMAWENVFHFAIVVGGDVVDIMRVQPKMATVLNSNPEFVQFDPKDIQVMPGWVYKDDKLVDPNLELKPEIFKLGEYDEK